MRPHRQEPEIDMIIAWRQTNKHHQTKDDFLSSNRPLEFARKNVGCRQYHIVTTVQEWSGALIPLTRQPVVSTANIAQLAVDLLIASLSLRVIGVFDSRDLVPVVGGREDEEEGITTPLECELRARSPISP